MANDGSRKETTQHSVLTPEQAAILEMYLQNLDNFFENIKESERIQVEIETLHLKRILTP